MKAITILQPFPSLIALGKKQYETRSWSTNYRGEIAIHAGLRRDKKLLTHSNPAFSLIPDGTILRFGFIIVIAQLTDCIKMTDEFILSMTELERAVGHWQVGNYAWKLENIQVLPEPIPYKGKLGFWEYNHE